MGNIIDVDLLELETVRPDVSHGVYGKTLLNTGVKLVLTRVTFPPQIGPKRVNAFHWGCD